MKIEFESGNGIQSNSKYKNRRALAGPSPWTAPSGGVGTATRRTLLGAAAGPCALFAMGASLATYPLTANVLSTLPLVALKLVVHPLLVWVLAVPVLGLEGVWVPVAVLMASMPTGINVYLVATRYEAGTTVAARTIFLSTAISVLTISAALYVFRS